MEIYVVIVSFIVSVLLITILFFALRSAVKRIDYNTKRYFVDKLQDYDYLIEEKEKILNELNIKIEEKRKTLEKEENEDKIIIVKEQKEYHKELKMPDYSDEDLFKKYKDIKNKFSFDEEKLINYFILKIDKEQKNDYQELIKIKNKFTSEKIYEIIQLNDKDEKEYIIKILDDDEINVVKKYIDSEDFKINKFITKLDMLIEKNDPIVYIYTGNKNKNYNHIDSIIETRYDENINEGIKIQYKGVLYDYSI